MSYKSIPFDQALMQQLMLVVQEISKRTPDAISSAQALESLVAGYIKEEPTFKSTKATLDKDYKKEMNELDTKFKDNEITRFDYYALKNPIDLKYAIDLNTAINIALVSKGLHPAKKPTEEQRRDVQPDIIEEEEPNAAPSTE